MAEKKYLSFTGVTEFYYGVLKDDDTGIEGTEATRIKFLQNISISTPQEIVKAYGDNSTAELAVSTDVTQLTTQFHHIPLQDRAIIYGWKTNTDNVVGLPASPNPPYIACMFARTREDGSKEYIGFTKGKFMMADVEGETQGESVTFGSDSTQGEFMPRKVDGFDEDMTFLIVADEPGQTTNRDKLYKLIFGVDYPTPVPVA